MGVGLHKNDDSLRSVTYPKIFVGQSAWNSVYTENDDILGFLWDKPVWKSVCITNDDILGYATYPMISCGTTCMEISLHKKLMIS